MTDIVGTPDGATPLDRDELEGLRFRHITTRGELDELEQANIQTGLRLLAQRRTARILTDDFALTLHKRLFGDVWSWAGTLRRTEKNIGVDPLMIAVELRTLLDDAAFRLEHDIYAPTEAALRLHHRMVKIHPFANGNGRHARIMADTVLTKLYAAPPIDWSAEHDLQRMNDRRRAYIDALRAADRGDYGPLFAFVGVREDL